MKNDILAIQETLIDPSATMLTMPTFDSMDSFFQLNDRGVSLSAQKKLKPQRVTALEDKITDCIWMTVNINSTITLIGNIYTNPNKDNPNNLQKVLENVDKAKTYCDTHKIKNIVILGDFNSRNIIWKDSLTNARGKVLAEYINNNNLLCVTPNAQTFLCTNGGSTIDLALLSPAMASIHSASSVDGHIELFSGAPLRGHVPVIHSFKIMNPNNAKEVCQEYKDIKNTDWNLWRSRLSYEITHQIGETIDNYNCPDILWSKLISIIRETNDITIPTKQISRHSKPFWTPSLSEMSKLVQTNKKAMCVRYTPANIEAYKKSKKQFADKLISEKNNWIRGQLEGLNVIDSKTFWKNYKRAIVGQNQESMGNLEEGGMLYTDVKEKENILYKTFFDGSHMKEDNFDQSFGSEIDHKYELIIGNTHSDQDSRPCSNNPPNSDNTELELEAALNSEISLQEVQSSIMDQKNSAKSFDEDGLHPTIIKKLPLKAIKILHKTFNLCLAQGKWVWDTAMVIFTKKQGKPNYMKAGAYRPISLSSYIGKLFEMIIEKRIQLHCSLESILDDEQEGFRPSRNTTRYLYKMTANLKEAQRKKLTSFLLCLDFEKAFDSVWHKGLIVKLHNLHIRGNILKLIANFLSSRKVKLIVDKIKGTTRNCGHYGVPQGSVLSPLLFIIYVSDLFPRTQLTSSCSKYANIYKYADDGSVAISHEDPKECHTIAQQMCDHLSRWCGKWRMIVNCNKNKTECLIIKPRYRKSMSSTTHSVTKLSINGKDIEYVKNTTVLGLVIDDNLTYEKHANQKIQQCWYAWYNISKNTTRYRGLNISSLVILFKAIVLSKLLYAAPVWLKTQLHKFKDLYSRVCLKISGSTHFPRQSLALLAMGLAPLSVHYDLVATKFILKSLHCDSTMKSMLLQIESVRSHPFYHHIVLVQRYITQKDPLLTFGRQSGRLGGYKSLANVDEHLIHYTKDDIEDFKGKLWNESLTYDETYSMYVHETELPNLNMETFSSNSKKLFPRTSTRITDTKIMSLTHGHSCQFKSYRYSLGTEDDQFCDICTTSPDTNVHQLLHCPKYNAASLREPLNNLSDEPKNFMWALLLNADPEQIRCYRSLAQIALHDPKIF
jgi:hypothetical protein